ncbi:hypothetical protein TWF788_007182 [Orbilia oligospora]|uniref:Uncharacterized protein n=1 Tax=Orbilia oligospora TaxID=2813651 RepID=A0A7C8UEN7_ORBOL|nr:hypothetical protein TWF788_007182 [Orbilia oligospora]
MNLYRRFKNIFLFLYLFLSFTVTTATLPQKPGPTSETMPPQSSSLHTEPTTILSQTHSNSTIPSPTTTPGESLNSIVLATSTSTIQSRPNNTLAIGPANPTIGDQRRDLTNSTKAAEMDETKVTGKLVGERKEQNRKGLLNRNELDKLPASIFFTVSEVKCPSITALVDMDTDPDNYPACLTRPYKRPDPALDYVWATHWFREMREVCQECRCTNKYGTIAMFHDITERGRCNSLDVIKRCQHWLECHCDVEMKSKPEGLTLSTFESFARAFNRVPAWVRGRVGDFRIDVGQGRNMRTLTWKMSKGDYALQPRRKFLMKDAAEPYYLEGPDLAPDENTDISSAPLSLGLWGYGIPNLSSGQVIKREAGQSGGMLSDNEDV